MYIIKPGPYENLHRCGDRKVKRKVKTQRTSTDYSNFNRASE